MNRIRSMAVVAAIAVAFVAGVLIGPSLPSTATAGGPGQAGGPMSAQCEAMMDGMNPEEMNRMCQPMMENMDHDAMHRMCQGMMDSMGNGMMNGRGGMPGMMGGMMRGMMGR